MSAPAFSPRIGIYGSDEPVNQGPRGCGLWAAGYEAVVTAAGGTVLPLRRRSDASWDELLESVDGVVFSGGKSSGPRYSADEDRLVEWCRDIGMPLLAVDHGLHVLNTAFGGTLYLDLAREMPKALQHQHTPEPGDRHAINVVPGTHLARFYGEGEIVVNSEHRRAICQVAREFRVSASALDGVIEAIESEGEGWFALGVQWHPASASASGLDIQLFRGFIEACTERRQGALPAGSLVAA